MRQMTVNPVRSQSNKIMQSPADYNLKNGMEKTACEGAEGLR